ncbi:hypothetical protein CLV80_107190 [Yoonia maritima]|uniref:Uncharacterized protein n=1 Tax=Yoonia maritima TaxID=1435347 RepID=A0A2T0VY27_9RHOB|nr:hypothetical protein [Yoonia maritima]PRY77012.1 hypothetical protein CLV80_107190 [Yoonia maritima]
MASLRGFLVDTLGDGVLSLRGAAAELGFDGGVSALDYISSVASGADGPFTPLYPHTDGTGAWHADRYRVYFFADRHALINEGDHFSHFTRLFPQIFDGEGPDMTDASVELLRRNIATNFLHSGRQFKGRDSLQFFGAADAFFSTIDATGLHDDWVGVIHSQHNSFAVQTLKRNFALGNDAAMAAALVAGLIAASTAAGATAGSTVGNPFVGGFLGAGVTWNPVVAVVGGTFATWINRYHFLAGYRSWKIGKLPTFEIENLPGSQANIYFLETASINRVSSWMIELSDLLGDVAIGSIDDLTRDVWTTLAHNWSRYGNDVLGHNLDTNIYRDTINALAGPRFDTQDGNVWINQGVFDSEEDLMAQDWVAKLLFEHPGIATRF